MSTGKRRSKVKLVGVLIIIAGALAVVAAGVTVGMTSSELRAEHITATAVSSQSSARPGGKSVADRFNVYSSEGKSSPKKVAMTLSDSRDSMKNGSFLRALLVIAAVSLCVAVPVMGVGVLIALVDFGPLKRSRQASHRPRKVIHRPRKRVL
jgi:hypothetical protein